jgi:hypothetical protein
MSVNVVGDGDLYYFKNGEWVDIGGDAEPWYQTVGYQNLVDESTFDLATFPSLTPVADGGTANVKGPWVELIASTSSNANALTYYAAGWFINNFNPATLIDIAFGAAGAETVVLENVAVGGAHNPVGTRAAGHFFTIPLKIPAGTRISTRAQTNYGAITTGRAWVATHLWGDYDSAPTSLEVLGTNTTDSSGFVPTANNQYFEFVSSTSQAYKAFILIPSVNAAFGGSSVGRCFLAVGASGSEQDILKILRGNEGSGEVGAIWTYFPNIVYRETAAGTRLAVKQTNGANVFSLCVIAVPA